jgi:hypothetical protein
VQPAHLDTVSSGGAFGRSAGEVFGVQVQPDAAVGGGVAPPVLLPADVRVDLDDQQRLGRRVVDGLSWDLAESRRGDLLGPGMRASRRFQECAELVADGWR